MTKIVPQRSQDDETSRQHQHALLQTEVGKYHTTIPQKAAEFIRDRIERVQNDRSDLNNFYKISISPKRIARLTDFYESELKDLKQVNFEQLNQDGKVDYLLLKAYLEREPMDDFDEQIVKKIDPLLRSWAYRLVEFCEARQAVVAIDPMEVAASVTEAVKAIKELRDSITKDIVKLSGGKSAAFRAAKVVEELKYHFEEAVSFYNDYDPMFTWWMAETHKAAQKQLTELAALIRKELVGLTPDDEDAIVGEPIGRDGLLADLKAEFIAYTPEELIHIGETEYKSCLAEMITASHALGHGSDWRSALEAVKNMYIPPGQQPTLVKELADEALSYILKHDLVTVPHICSETTRSYMMSPARQKVAPFFLGGSTIQISYPTSTMSHEQKLMSMRGNSRPFSRATVFHELIPGHHLQYYYIARHKAYRRALFDTPFWMEGWAMYWEYVLWDRGDFFVKPEDKIGTLFWRMHRCARIVFSIKFHLGMMSAEECVEYLVSEVGHERATAEGEVRRSLSGEYRPLYQCGYMLGALQLRGLRRECVEVDVGGSGSGMGEKEFHDRVLRENEMSIEILRALVMGKELREGYKAQWRFYRE